MNKAVIYFGATGNEAADQMVMQVLEEYCAVNGYEVVAVISENARPEGMTFPMKFAFVGMAEVEDVVSNDSANRHSTVFHAVPLTSKIHKKTYLPTHIFISSFKAVGLRTNSIAQCEQLCDVKDTDLIEKIGKVSKNQLRQITKGMQIQLGMSTKHNNPIA